jgi:hypothetical protein
LQEIDMSAWAIEQHRGCSIHILVVVGRSDGFKYAYTGFVCSPKQAALEYPKLERFHHVSPDFDSVDVAIAAGMQVGRAIAERWTSHSAQHQTSERPTRPPS